MDMNGIDELLGEVDEEIAQDEYEEIKKALIVERRETRQRWSGVKRMKQRVKCLLGFHGYVYGAAFINHTFCAHCKRMWTIPRGEK